MQYIHQYSSPLGGITLASAGDTKLTREILIELVDHYTCSKGISKENRCPFLGIFVCFMSILGLVTMQLLHYSLLWGQLVPK